MSDPLCHEVWHSEEVENLPTGMVKLLEKYHLAAHFAIPPELTGGYRILFIAVCNNFGS